MGKKIYEHLEGNPRSSALQIKKLVRLYKLKRYVQMSYSKNGVNLNERGNLPSWGINIYKNVFYIKSLIHKVNVKKLLINQRVN